MEKHIKHILIGVLFTLLFFGFTNKSLNAIAISDVTKENENIEETIKKESNQNNKVTHSKKKLESTTISDMNIETIKKESLDIKANNLVTQEENNENLISKEFTLSFYTSLPEENGGYEGLNAVGEQLEYGQIASNVYPIGTTIKLEGMGTFTVKDTGGSHFDSEYRLDVFIPIENGESEEEYRQRVMNLGRKDVKGYILN